MARDLEKMTKYEFLEQLDHLKKAIPILEKTGPRYMKHPDPSQPDIILSAESVREMLQEMESKALLAFLKVPEGI